MNTTTICLDEALVEEAENTTKAALKYTAAYDAGKLDGKDPGILVDLLAFTRRTLRDIDANYKVQTAPITSVLRDIDSMRKVLKGKLNEAEGRLHASVIELVRKGIAPAETKNGTKLSLSEIPEPRVVDANVIPDGFIRPRKECVNWELVKAEFAAGRSVPGIDVVNNIILRTKLPDVLDQ